MRRIIRILVDAMMVGLLIGVVVVTPDMHTHGHMFMGIGLLVLIGGHVFLNRKWLGAVRKVMRDKRASTELKGKYVVVILMLLAWTTVAVTSILAALSYLQNVEGLDVVEDYLHPWSGRIAGIIALVHLIQKRKSLMYLLQGKESYRGKKAA